MEIWKKWGNFKIRKNWKQQAINYEEYYLTVKEWALWAAAGTGACGAVAYTFYRSYRIFFVLLPLGLMYPLVHKKQLCQRRKEQLKSQFKEGVLILSASLSAGYSIENALKASVNELTMLYGNQGMLVKEFTWMVRQIGLNSTAEEVFEDFSKRSGIEEIQSFVQVFAVAKRSGGELVAIMNKTADSIRDKIQLHEEIRTMTASRQFEQKIMNLLPFFIILYIDITSPGFFDLMYTTGIGRILMTGCLVVYGLAIWIAGRILDIKVS
ncbi:MAG: type II secretion system F family protein [Lachnospirales bacterium]